MSTQEEFQAAQERVKTLTTRPSNEQLLKLYSLYKQASDGDVSGKRPGMFDMVRRAKYDAWAGQKGVAKDAARDQYVAFVDQLMGG